jgi:hypothetical protein
MDSGGTLVLGGGSDSRCLILVRRCDLIRDSPAEIWSFFNACARLGHDDLGGKQRLTKLDEVGR